MVSHGRSGMHLMLGETSEELRGSLALDFMSSRASWYISYNNTLISVVLSYIWTILGLQSSAFR